ncbi:RNA polymerase sigma factor [Streptosporangium amethystogenes subsp. fukuiense]|uniref:RNA polymerase sigma factor n=1 Tax=Streptosporangium amethystogenes subsp. fukuiense TaxID=698418 RepID=A0ABW2T9L3_9ACTN
MPSRDKPRRPDPPKLSFTDFYRTHRSEVIGFLWHYAGPGMDAEDIAAEAFARAFAKWDRITQPRPWIYATAKNLAHREGGRARKTHPGSQTGDDHRSESWKWSSLTPWAGVEAGVIVQELVAALQHLPPQQRAAVLLEARGWKRGEIAEILQCSQAAVRVHLHLGRKRLKKLISESAPAPQRAPRTGMEGRPA